MTAIDTQRTPGQRSAVEAVDALDGLSGPVTVRVGDARAEESSGLSTSDLADVGVDEVADVDVDSGADADVTVAAATEVLEPVTCDGAAVGVEHAANTTKDAVSMASRARPCRCVLTRRLRRPPHQQCGRNPRRIAAFVIRMTQSSESCRPGQGAFVQRRRRRPPQRGPTAGHRCVVGRWTGTIKPPRRTTAWNAGAASTRSLRVGVAAC